jgi:hypothetical protein
MEHRIDIGHGSAQEFGVSDVGLDQLQARSVTSVQPAQVALAAGSRQAIVNADAPSLGQQTAGQIGADEARSPGDQDRCARPHRY